MTDWWLTEPVDGADVAVAAYVGSSSCSTFDHLDIREDDDRVLIRAFVVTEEGGDRDCTADLTWEVTEVRLQEPLGDRELVGCAAPAGGHRAPGLDRGEQVDCPTQRLLPNGP